LWFVGGVGKFRGWNPRPINFVQAMSIFLHTFLLYITTTIYCLT